MPSHPNRSPAHNKPRIQKSPRVTAPTPAQHGIVSISHILSIPPESTAYITAYLDPLSLAALGRVNRHFHEHVKQDTTWLKAFSWHCFQVAPESDVLPHQRLLLRRNDVSWRDEFINRFRMTRRWERSCSAVYHTPLPSPITSFILLPAAGAVLASSLTYGVVSRSFIHTGKVLKGFLDARGHGPQNGNPNVEFSPDVSSIAMKSSGGSAAILWGFLSGSVAYTTAPRVMDLGRSAKVVQCHFGDAHLGKVEKVAFPSSEAADSPVPRLFVSAGADGMVKIWDTSRVRCLWTSEPGPSLVPDPCVELTFDLEAGVVVAGMTSGTVAIWTFVSLALEDTQQPLASNFSLHIPPPIDSPQQTAIGAPSTIQIASATSEEIALFVHHAEDRHFYRLSVCPTPKIGTQPYLRIRYDDGPLGPITSLKTSFVDPTLPPLQEAIRTLQKPATIARSVRLEISTPSTPSLTVTKSQEQSLVLAGDALGRVCLWDWNHNSDATVSSCKKWEAHDDGAVSALQLTSLLIISGSSSGTIKIWDSLSLQLLNTIPPSSHRVSGPLIPGDDARRVGQIIVHGDTLVASIGRQILAWRAGPAKKEKYGGKNQKSPSRNKVAAAKWRQQIELSHDIRESKVEINAQRKETQHVVKRVKAQTSVLSELGLNEIEALEYVLMLSRDEATAGPSSTSGEYLTEQDMEPSDEVFRHVDERSDSSPSTPVASYSSSYSHSSSPVSYRSAVSPSSNSVAKVENTPPFSPAESIESGLAVTPLDLDTSNASSSSSTAPKRAWTIPSTEFPAISPSTSSISRSSVSSGSVKSGGSGTGKDWSSVVRLSSPPTPLSAGRSTATGPSMAPSSSLSDRPSLLAVSLARYSQENIRPRGGRDVFDNDGDDEEAQLRRALERSLIEM